MKAVPARHKIVTFDALLAERQAWRSLGLKVVWTNGCFDLLHAGHVYNLEYAAAQGDRLVVGLNSDASVRRLKGPTRPLVPQDERAVLIAALACVDAVCFFDDDTPVNALARLQPDIHCKGDEYAPPHGKPIPELPVVLGYGGEIRFIPLVPVLSTTDLVRRITEIAPVRGA